MNEQQIEIAKEIVSAISSDYYLEQASKMFEYDEDDDYDIDLRYLCNVSSEFQSLWENDKEEIQEIAAMYLKETNDNEYFVSESVLFVEWYGWESLSQDRLMGTTVRYNFLKWLEEKLI